MAHLIHILATVFFWVLGIVFFLGLIGCVFVVIFTSVDDLKEMLAREKEPTRESPHFED